jgi:hypothetical protein
MFEHGVGCVFGNACKDKEIKAVRLGAGYGFSLCNRTLISVIITPMRTVCAFRLLVKRTLLAVGKCSLFLCLLVAGCKKPIAENPPEPPDSEVAALTPATPPPLAAPAVPEATTPPDHLAPPGVYFLLGKASVETDSGIIGLRPGARIQETGPGEYASVEGHKLPLRPDQVTNDLRIVQQIIGADAAAQNALRQMQAQQAVRPTVPVAPTPTIPAPKVSSAPVPTQRPTTSLGGSGSLGASHTRVQGGFYWEKDANGNWRRGRPVNP